MVLRRDYKWDRMNKKKKKKRAWSQSRSSKELYLIHHAWTSFQNRVQNHSWTSQFSFPRSEVWQSSGHWDVCIPFLCFFPSSPIWFSSNFEPGGEESALLVLFIMEIDLTLICIYLHRHQADLETRGGCNLLWSWQICSKNRTLELSNQLWRACSLALLISAQHGQSFREIQLVVKKRKETFVAFCYK